MVATLTVYLVLSRHTVECHAAQEVGREYIDSKKECDFHTCGSTIPYPSAQLVRNLHTKFQNISLAISEMRIAKVSLDFFIFSSSFRTLCKIHHKTQMHTPIQLKFSTLKGLIKANLSTSLVGIQEYSRSYDQLFT